ncbi:MAG TPA: autotransporter-associated beta strand repeat-containing protein [Candidatus Acidoferrales bacterium]|jgi:fibronectin-binding autotransporter adhesin|nr:autotransporter-associated beta strand repeat-containing protein [Candidatus Acidoferrales bacterium]
MKSIRFIAAGFAVLFTIAAHGNTLTWSGSGANAFWSNSANWGGVGTPGNGDTLIFKGAANVLNTNNIAGLTLSQIFFGGSSGFHLRGSAFAVSNSITATNSAVTNIIENNITLTNNNVLLVVSSNVTLTLEGIIDGVVGVNKTGMGTLIYQCPNTNPYTGTTLVTDGTLQLNVAGYSAFNGPLVIGGDTFGPLPTVQNLQPEEIPETVPITIYEDGALDLNNWTETIGPNLTLDGGSIYTGTGLLLLSPNTTITVTNASGEGASIYGNLNTGSGTLTLRGNGDPLQVNGYPGLSMWANVSGNANIVQHSTATFFGVFWEAANTYTGNYVVDDICSIYMENSQALGNINNTLTINNQGQIALGKNINLTNQSVTVNGGNTGGAFFVYGPSTNTWRANFNFNSAGAFAIETNTVLNLIGPIGGSGGLVKDGPGTLTFSGLTANTYSGTTTVTNGILLLNKPFQTPAIPGPLVLNTNTTVRLLNHFQIYNGTIPITLADSSRFDLAGFDEWVGPISLKGAQITAGAGFLYFSGNITVNASTKAQSVISGNAIIYNGTYVITNSGHHFSPDMVFSANLANSGGGGGLIKDGAGEVALLGNNSFTGPVTVNAGNLWAETSTALGNTNTPLTVSNGATLFLDGNGLDFGLKPLVLNGTGYSFGALSCSGSSSWGGGITLGSDSTINQFTGSSLTLTGAISGVGGYIKVGPGTNMLSGTQANTYAGTTTASAGTLILGKAYGIAAVPGNLVINSGSTVRLTNSLQTANTADILVNSGGLFDFSTFPTYTDTLRGTGTVNFGVDGWIYLGLNNGSSEFDGLFTGSGYLGGFTVGKTGSGTFTIGGNSTYTAGITHVFSGKVVVNGSQPLIPVAVEAGAVLAGSGTVGAITGNGVVAPGNSPGILTGGDVNFSASGSLAVIINGTNAGTGYSQLNVDGTVNLGGAALQLSLGTAGAVNNQYVIITNDAADVVVGTFAGLPEGSAVVANNGTHLTISYHGGSGNDVVLTQTNLPTQPVLAGAQTLGDGSIQINGSGITNQTYTVLATTNLLITNWDTIGTVTAPALTNALQFVDLNATNYPQRFYRFSWP